MSDNIPFEIQVEIIKRLPVKSLIQFRSVSKTWKSLIDSSAFVAHHSRQHTQMQHILLKYDDLSDFKTKYVSVVDDGTFPSRRVSLPPPLSENVDEHYSIIGCSQGLFCFKRLYQVVGRAVLWNPSIRKTVDVVVPNVANGGAYRTVVGFGVCRDTNDPKIVKITYLDSWGDMEIASCIPWQVEVFTLSTGAWRTLGGNLPSKLVHFDLGRRDCCSVVIDGVIYWFVTDVMITMDGGSCNQIISFDVTSEEFGEVNLPNSLAHPRVGHGFSMFKLRESLVVLEDFLEADRRMCDVWMMEGGVPLSFTKLYTFNLNTVDCYARAMGFRKSGEYIIEIVEVDRGHLVVYEPHSEHIENLGIDGVRFTPFAHPYIETLLLHDHNDMETAVNIQDDLVP